MSATAGGSATNSGIDYQQRVAALAMAHSLTGLGFLEDFGLNEEAEIEEIHFESENSIDDIVLVTNTGQIFIQAKRSISLSHRFNSEFSSVLGQFCGQYIKDRKSNQKYVLAVSPASSSKIIRDLRKLSESARLNGLKSLSNPLSKSESEVLQATKNLSTQHFLSLGAPNLSDEDFLNYLSNIHIAVLDLEKGGTLERAVITLLATESAVPPSILWDALISLGLTLSKNRQSISKAWLKNKLERFFESSKKSEPFPDENSFFEIKPEGDYFSGREFTLIESFIKEYDYLLIESIRFNDDGSKNVKFKNNKIILKNGHSHTVIARASTRLGIERYITNNKEKFQERSVGAIYKNIESDIERMPFPLAHSKLCQKIISNIGSALFCIHCGDPISNDMTPTVEIDEEGVKHEVGYSHESCLRPTDRVIGRLSSELFKEHPKLRNFDYSGWYRSLVSGQGLLAGLQGGLPGIYPIAWNPGHNPYSKGKWCVKFNLEDGSTRYAHQRGQVKKMSEQSAIEWAEKFNIMLSEAKKNDPICYSSNGDSFSTYSQLIKILSNDEHCVLCENAVPEKIDRSIESAYSSTKLFYAPLFLFLDQESGLPIIHGTFAFLLSDPLRINHFLDNWKKAGIELPEYSISIIHTDHEFDKTIEEFKSDGLNILIDPILKPNGELAKGLVIENINEIPSN
ncbi:hypothetical protein [Pseudomonas chlororaphis]|uniref:hypothetical protein n=1 Tax=Pseudomonas chlororaphis TaxID=587753 RepID=UPI0011CD3E0B|nr:hypothetical protein [Pseudomonas chlororaphis]